MDSERPVFVQIIEVLEDGMLDGTYGVGDPVASTNQITRLFRVNPETAVKALRTLGDPWVVERRRGLGMAVLPDAQKSVLGRSPSPIAILLLARLAPVLLFDEPTLGFEPTMGRRFYQAPRADYDDRPRPVIASTHVVDEVEHRGRPRCGSAGARTTLTSSTSNALRQHPHPTRHLQPQTRRVASDAILIDCGTVTLPRNGRCAGTGRSRTGARGAHTRRTAPT